MEKAIRIGIAFNSGVQESSASSLLIQPLRRQAEELHRKAPTVNTALLGSSTILF